MWKRGKTLITPITRRWSKAQIEDNDAQEGLVIFSDFLLSDNGASRKRVCTLNPAHIEFEKNRAYIENAPEMVALLEDIAFPRRGSESENWTIEDVASAAANLLSKINSKIPA